MINRFAIALYLLFSSFAVKAELMIEITKGSDSALPIAVVPFSVDGQKYVPENVGLIIANDLQRSGDFDLLSSSKMFSLPDDYNSIHFKDWRMLGQSYVLVGKVTPTGNSFKIQYELVDVFTQQRIAGEKISTTSDGLRKVAHYISDMVYEKITGVKGVFSTKIAYITVKQLTAQKREYRLKVADADGYGAYTLLKTSEPILSPAWSNDGTRLAYASFHSGRPAIYIQNIQTGKQKKVTAFKGLNDSPMWSPDDSSLLLTLSKDGNAELYNLDLKSNSLKRLTNHYRIDTEGSWSPDGKSVVFTSDRGFGTQVYKMDIDDLEPQRITFEGRYNARPRYSRDGRTIFYVHKSTVPGDNGFHIAALDIESGDQQILTSTSLDESPSLSPNGRMIIYSTLRGKDKVLGVVSIDGGAKYFLPSPLGDVLEPAWSPFM